MTERYQKLWKNFCGKLVSPLHELTARAKLCSQFWPDESNLSLRTSNQLLQDTFLFQLPWDMEQTVEPVSFPNGIDWSYFPGEDEEFTFQINRHRYWICLGQAYHATGNEDYARCFVKQLTHWLITEPLRPQAYTHTWRTIEAGLRANYWCRAMALFAHSPSVTEPVIEQFLHGLELHAQRLYENPRTGFSMKSNWGVLEYSGLYLLGFVLNETTYVEHAKQFLKHCLHIQIMEDGMQWEASPMYHNEVLMCMMEAIRISRIYGDNLFTSEELALIQRMAYVDLYLKNPEHHQPMIGDSDDTDLRDLITQAAYLFQDGMLKTGGFKTLDYESIWLYGTQAVQAYANLSPQPVPDGLTWLEQSGQVILRSGWKQNDFWLYYINGNQGGGHGHSDKLHLSLWIDGEEILTDPGRYTYTDTNPRYTLKNAISHNVPMVNRKEYAPAIESWSCARLPVSTPNQVYQKGIYTLIEGGHTGYANLGITVMRRIVSIGWDIVVICDRFIGPNVNEATQRFHFGETIQLTRDRATLFGRGKNCTFQMHTFSQHQICRPQIEEGLFSRHYNQFTTTAVADITVPDTSVLTTIFIRSTGQIVSVKPTPVTNFSYGGTLQPTEGEGYIIQAGKQRYGLVLLHQDVGNAKDLNGIEQIYGLGRTMVCDLNSSPEFMTILQW